MRWLIPAIPLFFYWFSLKLINRRTHFAVTSVFRPLLAGFGGRNEPNMSVSAFCPGDGNQKRSWLPSGVTFSVSFIATNLFSQRNRSAFGRGPILKRPRPKPPNQ
jgi:hypothetical protein